MPATTKGELIRRRQRREKRAKNTTAAASNSSTSAVDKQNDNTVIQKQEEDMSLWTVFSSHPLVQVAAVILPIFLLYRAYYFFMLQHPEYLQPLIDIKLLRPAIALHDERQLLIVGCMSSGTTQVATELSNKLHLEVSHEASDAYWYFCRDGTVSWFHGIRFLPEPTSASIHVNKLIRFCTNFTANMGFHPSMYRSTSTCGGDGGGGFGGGTLRRLTSTTWSPCWTKECLNILSREWGCATKKEISGSSTSMSSSSSSSSSCETPFRRVLHQVRHPLRTVESLVTKFCVGGVNGTVNPSFVQFMGSLFDFYNPSDSCIEAATKYVLYYTNAMLDARQHGWISAMYRVEDVTPCQIAELAGLVVVQDKENHDIVYEPNRDKIQRICGTSSGIDNVAKEKLSSGKYQINQGQLTLNWFDLQGGVHGSTRPKHDTELQVALRKLTMDLGYKINDEDDDGDDNVPEFMKNAKILDSR